MALKVRSSAGDLESNVTTPQCPSPATITLADLLALIKLTNEDTTGALTHPSGFTERYDQEDVSMDSRNNLADKTADSDDVTNAGTDNHYDTSGYGATDDHLFGCLAIYDDALSVTPVFVSASRNEEATGGSSTQAPSQTITKDGSLVVNCWNARGGTDYFNIGASNSLDDSAQASTKLSDAWAAHSLSGMEWVVYAHECNVSDSPYAPTLSYSSITADGLGQECVSYLFEPGVVPLNPHFIYGDLIPGLLKMYSGLRSQ